MSVLHRFRAEAGRRPRLGIVPMPRGHRSGSSAQFHVRAMHDMHRNDTKPSSSPASRCKRCPWDIGPAQGWDWPARTGREGGPGGLRGRARAGRTRAERRTARRAAPEWANPVPDAEDPGWGSPGLRRGKRCLPLCRRPDGFGVGTGCCRTAERGCVHRPVLGGPMDPTSPVVAATRLPRHGRPANRFRMTRRHLDLLIEWIVEYPEAATDHARWASVKIGGNVRAKPNPMSTRLASRTVRKFISLPRHMKCRATHEIT